MSLKFDRPCSFFLKGNCNKGDECPYSHDQKVELERNDQGKLVPKRGTGGFRGRGRGREEKNRDQEQDDDNPQPYQKFNRDNNSERRGSSYERKPYERKPYEKRQFERKPQNSDQGVDSARWGKHNEQEEEKPKQDDNRNNRPYQRKPYERERNTNQNAFKKWERNDDTKIATADPEEQVIIKRVKRNEIVVPKRDKMYKLEQIYEVDNFVQLLGYEHEFMGVLSSTEIQFFLIPFKRTWSDIIDEEKRVVIKQKDKVLLNGWLQEAQLIVQFQVEDDPIKNLLIFENVFQNQTPKVVYDIGVKNLVYCYLESGMLYTFCSDGLIRIFNQQYKYINHYDLEQGIESAIKVGSNYLIGTRNGKLILFDGQIATEIPFKTDMKCTQMILDFNRVILKLDQTNETHIYVLNQQLEIIGPLYKGGRVNSIEMLKSYENEKLYILVCDNTLDTFKEQGNKFHIINTLNQAFNSMKKMEITNENMVTQKYIFGIKGNQLQLYSLIPEQ